MARITPNFLQKRLALICKIIGAPQDPYKLENGNCVAQVGCIYLESQCGFHNIMVMANERGTVSNLFTGSLKECLAWTEGALSALRLTDESRH